MDDLYFDAIEQMGCSCDLNIRKNSANVKDDHENS